MPNYKEITGIGTSWMRARNCFCDNTEGRKSIHFDEEVVFIASDGYKLSAPTMLGCTQYLTADNTGEEFQILDMNGNPTGTTAKFQDMYIYLMSLYYHVANKRDLEAASNVQP